MISPCRRWLALQRIPRDPFTILEVLRRDSLNTANLRTLHDLFVTNSGEPPSVMDDLIRHDVHVFGPISFVALATTSEDGL